MMKKLLATGAAAALFLGAAVPAFAFGGFPMWPMQESSLDVHMFADVDNVITTVANTGFNFATGGQKMIRSFFHHAPDSDIDVHGDATAVAEVTTQANFVDVAGCGCFDDVKIRMMGKADNMVFTTADTGHNMVMPGKINVHGNAEAGALVTTMINTVMFGADAEN